MVLRGDLDPACFAVEHRLIGAAVAELEFERLATQGQAEELMAQANAEHRFLADQLANGLDGVLTGSGSPGPLDRKMPSGLQARTSSAVAVPGITVTRQPTCTRQRRMFHFMPKSRATT